MPNFEAMNNLSHKSVRNLRLKEKLQRAMETKKSNTLAFLRRKFPSKDIYGYMIGSVSRINYADKAGWDMVAYFYRVNKIPGIKFAGYDVYPGAGLSDACKKLLVTLTGDSGYLSLSTLFFCRR